MEGISVKRLLSFIVIGIILLNFIPITTIGTLTFGPEIRITTNKADQILPAIYGDYIVWQDKRNGNWDIYMHQISTGNETQITSSPANEYTPKIHGDYIVWHDERYGNRNIFYYQISTGNETQITANTSNQWHPAIYNDTIVYCDDRYGDKPISHPDIFMYQISKEKETQITTNVDDQWEPSIYENYIVWTDYRNRVEPNVNRDIYMYNISNSTEIRLTTNTTDQQQSAIYGDYIVWSDLGSKGILDFDVYLYQISTGQEKMISGEKFDQQWPDIYEDYVVWFDNRDIFGTQDDIYLYNINTGTEIQVTTNNDRQKFPAIHNNTIVWQDNRNGNWDIYMRVIESEQTDLPPIADAGDNQTISEGDNIQLDGTSSYDQDGDLTEFSWDFDSDVDSDGDGNLTNDVNSNDPTTTHIYGDDGVYTVTLTVTDNQGLSSSDTCIITVLNVDPTLSIESAIMETELSIRVAGSKWSNVGLTLYEDEQVIGYLEVERWPGSPDDNPGLGNPTIPIVIDLTKRYKAVLTYDPYPDKEDEINGDQPNNGKDKSDNAGNPVWLIIKFRDGSEEKIHHTFNTQQSKKRSSDHQNHIEPWELDLNDDLIGNQFEVTYQIIDPGSDDEHIDFVYNNKTINKTFLNNPPIPDSYPSPEINPREIMDVISLIYGGSGMISLIGKDDDNMRLGFGNTVETFPIC